MLRGWRASAPSVNILTDKLILERLELAGWRGALANAEQLRQFVDLITKWNRKINLTSLQLEPVSAEAIDRLIVEPVLASRFVRRQDVAVVDLGSGGGSPAIPFKIQLPGSSLRMIESRSRKCAFLREAVRQLGLSKTIVEESRFELLMDRQDLRQSADVISVRAVRFDEPLLALIRWLLVPGGEVFRFTHSGDLPLPSGVKVAAVHKLVPAISSELQVVTLD